MKKVLIIDDSALAHKVYRIIFSKYSGVSIHDALDCREASEMLRSEDFNLILLDINMPSTNGLQFLETIKGDPRLSGIPVVIVSSSENPEHKEAAHRLGIYHFVPKSKTDMLSDIISQTLFAP